MRVWAVLHLLLTRSAPGAIRVSGGLGEASAGGGEVASGVPSSPAPAPLTCVKPTNKTDNEAVCAWLHCKYHVHRAKLENKRKDEYKAVRDRVFLKHLRVRNALYKAYAYASQGAHRQCQPWGPNALSDFEAFIAELLPEAHGCVSAAMEIHSKKSEKCNEIFSREFAIDVHESCQNEIIFHQMGGISGGHVETAEKAMSAQNGSLKSKIRNFGRRTDWRASGPITAAVILAITTVMLLAGFAGAVGAVITGILGAGMLATIIALVVCTTARKKQPGWSRNRNLLGDLDRRDQPDRGGQSDLVLQSNEPIALEEQANAIEPELIEMMTTVRDDPTLLKEEGKGDDTLDDVDLQGQSARSHD